MTRPIHYLLFVILSVMIGACKTGPKTPGPSKVELKKNALGQHRLYVDGEEFYVKGAGCEGGDVAALAAHGANSFRTWMDQEIRPTEQSVLDDAQENGLKVLMGLEVGRERHGFDYNDEAWVAAQFDTIKAKVLRYKDHPALLGWIIGNEINLGARNLKVFDAVNDISKMIHEVDPNHVTTFTLAGIGKRDVDYIKEHCTDVDFISIQMYADIENLAQRIADAGWEGPYMVTEWGATGHWEVAKTEWGVAIEPTSQEKANSFVRRYDAAIAADPFNCMGSYAFLWGQKQERTPTWYGMFLENGNETEVVDAMHLIWNGEWPANRCPTLDSLRLNGLRAYDNVKLKTGGTFTAEVFAKDYEGDSLAYRWEILPESTDLGWGGDFENRPDTFFSVEGTAGMELEVPKVPGPYRLFIYVTDPGNKSATANIPFLVEG
jgi:hypothetical protein